MIVYKYYGLLPEIKLSYLILSYKYRLLVYPSWVGGSRKKYKKS